MIRSQATSSRLAGLGLAVLFIMGLAACGGPPKWVQKGSGAFNEKDSKAFYGVGAVSGVRNAPLAWETAENRGRAEIAKTFGVKIYAIGAGTRGQAPFLTETLFGKQVVWQEVPIDEPTLQQVAEISAPVVSDQGDR